LSVRNRGTAAVAGTERNRRFRDGKIGWLGALEDLVNIDRGASIHVG